MLLGGWGRGGLSVRPFKEISGGSHFVCLYYSKGFGVGVLLRF